jgi:hypothetical protein
MSVIGRARWIAVGAAAVIVPVAVARHRARRRLAEAEAEIRMRGLVGRGTVLAARKTGRTDADGRHEVELQLDVFVPRFRRFVSSTVAWVTTAQLDRLDVGKAVPVTADPDDPGHVVVSFDMDDPVPDTGLGPIAGGPGGPPKPVRNPKPKRAEPAADR